MDLYLIFLILIIVVHLPESVAVHNQKYDVCSYDQPCGEYSSKTNYPLYDGSTRPDYCGYPGFKFVCNDTLQQITILNQTYQVNQVEGNTAVTNQSTGVMVSRMDKWTRGCPDSLTNTTIDYSKFSFSLHDTQNVTFFYDCLDGDYSIVSLRTKCDLGGHGLRGGYYFTEKMLRQFVMLDMQRLCKANLFIPVMVSEADVLDANATLKNLIVALQNGFWLGLIADNDACSSCVESGGLCGYDWDSNKFVCHCADADYYIKCGVNFPKDLTASPNPRHLMKNKIFITASSAAITATVLGLLVLFTYCIIKNYKSIPKNQSAEECLKNCASMVLRRYTYANIKKMTKSFKEKLGEGGYGTVFKGTLQDGRVVAVKVWKQSKGDGQDFLNEVMSISRTSHVNIVPLLGFCFDGRKRALLYEFMPNGSLEKFIHKRDINDNSHSLSPQKLLEIAIGIARGLEYLHRGCNTRIVHFDIKPHNILLDAEFTPKISDFGLAKSFNQKESIISMSGARGTAGYIAPEVFFRTFGGVSHKSDVYSFGMMVLEMVGCTKKVNHNVENSSELYFPEWIYKQLERGLALDCRRILNEEEKELERNMVLVGLWCIQTNPLSRPPISRVVEMLEGKVELQVPPMPSLSSIPRQQEQQPASEEYSSTLTLSSTTPEITDHFHSVRNC